MDASTFRPAKILVLDTGAIVKHPRLETVAEEFFTVPEVIAEVKDSKSKAVLESFLFPIVQRVPKDESLKIVTEFSKKTGDYASLSLTDLKVLALTYEIDVEAHGGSSEHLKTVLVTQSAKLIKPIYHGGPPTKKKPKTQSEGEEKEKNEHEHEHEHKEGHLEQNDSNENKNDGSSEKNVETPEDKNNESPKNNQEIVENSEMNQQNNELKDQHKDASESQTNENQESTDQVSLDNYQIHEEDHKEEKPQNNQPRGQFRTNIGMGKFTDHNDGWITPTNIEQANESNMALMGRVQPKKQLGVALMTADFSIQNVLLQMKLKLISVDGLQVKFVKKWILRCFACNKLCRSLKAQFCSFCGGHTLQKVSYRIDSQGVTHVYLKRDFPNLRGTIYPIPRPKGGKHNKDIIISASQIPKKQFPNKKKSGTSDDAFLQPRKFNTTGKRVVVGYGNRNPNESRRKIGKKNKTKKREV